MSYPQITGIILAGGKGFHSKSKQSFVEIDQEIKLLTLHNLIKLFCSEIIISTNHPESYVFLRERIVPDEIEGIGPIGGIISALKRSSFDKSLVVASDMPMVPSGLIQLLISKRNDAEFVVPASGTGTIEPLCAIYDKSVISALTAMIRDRDYKIQHLRYYCRTALVEVYNGYNIFSRVEHS